MRKKIFSLLAAVVFVFLGFTIDVQGQDDLPKYGNDSITCIRNLSLYKEFVRQGNFIDAKTPWNYCFNSCPKSTKNIYIDGVKIMYHFINKQTDEISKQAYIDTLMMVHNQRIKYFGQEGFVRGRQGVDLLKFRPDDVMTAYGHLTFSIKDRKKSTEDAVGVTFMQSSVYLYKNEEIDKAELVDNFFMASKYFKERLESLIAKGKAAKYIEKTKTAIKSIDNYFMNSGAADCEVLIPYFEPKFNETPGDLEMLKDMTNLLNGAECTSSELFFMGIKQRYKIEPSAEAAYLIAVQALKRENYEESAKYYLEAIEKQQDLLDKARYYYELGTITFNLLKKPELARQYAYKSIELNSESGKPYMLIGNIYANSARSCGENDFEKNAVYWAAVDKYKKAKQVDPEIAEEANAAIVSWSKYFPNSENAFFYGINEGDIYTVGCWINEKTKVRF